LILVGGFVAVLALFWFLLYREAWLRRRVEHLLRKHRPRRKRKPSRRNRAGS